MAITETETPLWKAAARAIRYWGPRRCPACGRHARLRRSAVLWPALVEEWELTPELHRAIDEREGTACLRCGSSLRARQLAEVLVDRLNARLGTRYRSLDALCRSREAAGLRVAEINAVSGLHPFLARLGGLEYSEYGSDDPQVPSQDLMRLGYEDGRFDLVVTSETLEHVPDIGRALAEIRRVLKPDGLNVFTVPIRWDRPTRQRARVEGGGIVHLLPPSYHGTAATGAQDLIVFYEFGTDTAAIAEAAGFHVETVRDTSRPALTTFVATPGL
jgi:SAM-dependent methyltransferase